MERCGDRVWLTLCGSILALVVIVACRESDGDQPGPSSHIPPTFDRTGTGGVTTVSIETVVPPERTSRTESDSCTIPGACLTTTRLPEPENSSSIHRAESDVTSIRSSG
jgi:hypothetical protein